MMINKQCFTLVDCSYRNRCAYADASRAEARQYFQPRFVDEHCDMFKAKPPRKWGEGKDTDND